MGYLKTIELSLDERLEKAMRREPDIRNNQLMERFGCTLERIRKMRKKLGIYSEQSDFITKSEIKRAAIYSIDKPGFNFKKEKA